MELVAATMFIAFLAAKNVVPAKVMTYVRVIIIMASVGIMVAAVVKGPFHIQEVHSWR